MGAIVQAEISAVGGTIAAWQQPVRAYFRRTAAGWKLIGLDRGIGGAAPTKKVAQRKQS